ncbi:MAG: hypothetical protein VW576_09330, partial [Opitutae bacterium]
MCKTLLIVIFVLSFFVGCEEEEPMPDARVVGGSALDRKERIRELEADLEVVKWENVRLSLKIRKVDGSALVRDK